MPKNDISISLGSLSGSIFLLEMGPGWTVHLNPDGYVEGRMEETMEPAAINRHPIYGGPCAGNHSECYPERPRRADPGGNTVPLASFLLDGDVPAYYGS